LCRAYLLAAGVGSVDGGAGAALTLDLGDGAAWRDASGPRLWGGVVDGELLLGVDPVAGAVSGPVLEILAAGEAVWRVHDPHVYRFAL